MSHWLINFFDIHIDTHFGKSESSPNLSVSPGTELKQFSRESFFFKCTSVFFLFVKIYVLRKINKNLNKKISVTRLFLSDWVGLKRRTLLLDEANQFLTRRKKTTLKVFVWHLKIEQLRIRIKLDIQDVPTTLAVISCN